MHSTMLTTAEGSLCEMVSTLLWNRNHSVKIVSNWVMVTSVSALMVANAGATVTNASWTFPAARLPAPSQPIAANLSSYSTNSVLGWTEADNRLAETFVFNPGDTTALEFSYNGNHPAYLNGSTLTLTFTISGLTNDFSLANVQLSYDTRWNKFLNSLTETWAYSLDGGPFVNFETDTVTGNVWQTQGSLLSGLTLKNDDTIVFRDTFSGAAGINGNLDFDNIQIFSEVIPEPYALALVALGISFAGLRRMLRLRPNPANSRQTPDAALTTILASDGSQAGAEGLDLPRRSATKAGAAARVADGFYRGNQRTSTTSIRSPFFRSVTNVASLVLCRKKSRGNAT